MCPAAALARPARAAPPRAAAAARRRRPPPPPPQTAPSTPALPLPPLPLLRGGGHLDGSLRGQQLQSARRADGAYVRHWLPELANVPTEKVHEPWRLGSLVTASQREFTVDCNWKLFIEVFNEYYHLRKVHPNSFSAFYANMA